LGIFPRVNIPIKDSGEGKFRKFGILVAAPNLIDHFQYLIMSKALTFVLLLLISYGATSQVVGRVNPKTKEFSIAPDQKVDFTVMGYQFPNTTTKTMICFSSSESMVREEGPKCLLGAYFDTERMKPGDKILYVGVAGKFARMKYVAYTGQSAIFYIPKSSFVIK
jgi:hypothetical protein